MKVCPTCSNEWPDDQKFCPNDGSALRSAAGTADLVGSVIGGNYHIKKKLGEGGMGAVYLGEHVKMSRKSAIKVMTQSMAHDPDAIARFNREATNAARINHPNVCAIYDFGESDGLIFLAMEFIEGGSLSSLIEQGALAPQRAASILQQTGDALQAAHDLGIVHRDLKPDNIMIAKGRGGADVVKVVDFGIAKAMGGEEGQKVTKTGLVVGTPEYMSPEQLSGDKLDGRSDIYSLALVFFRMITGTLPFQADSAQETMIKRLTDDPMKLAEALPGVTFPPRLQQVMDKALARMPTERYAGAAEFARDVSAAVQGMGGGAAAVQDDGATQMISALDAKTAAVQATRVGGRGGSKTQIATPPTPMPQATVVRPTQEKKKPVALIAAVVVVLAGGGGAAAFFMKGDNANAGAPKQEEQARVMPDTAIKQPGGNTSTASIPPTGTPSQAGTQRPAGTQPTNPGTQTDPRPQQTVAAIPNANAATNAVDTMVVSKDLEKLGDDIFDVSARAQARRKAQAYYDNPDVPRNQRAAAILIVALSYFQEQRVDEACRYNSLALGLEPRNESYLKFKRDQACP